MSSQTSFPPSGTVEIEPEISVRLSCAFSHIVFVPCSILASLNLQVGEIPILYATREDEAIALACGLMTAGQRPLVMMQNSGLVNSLNTLGSLAVAYGIGLPILVTLRGDRDDQNMTQRPIGLATRGIIGELGLDIFDLPRRQNLEPMICRIANMRSDAHRPYVLLVGGRES